MTSGAVLDASDATFQTDVIERSRELPVVVDFWAPWCGPCRVLGPTLETIAYERAGEVQLVKINVDENPGVATSYQVQGIPAVKAFRNGEVVSEFVGALPEPQVRSFFDSIVPSAADQAVAAAEHALRIDQPGAARLHLEHALEQDPDHRGASAALAGILLADGEIARARELAVRFPGEPAAARVLAQLAFRDEAGDASREELEARLEADSEDAEAHYALGCLLAAEGKWQDALEHLLATVRLDRGVAEDGGRLRMLDAFTLLGDGDELTRRYRQRLTNLIF
ncbi:MAG: thioredoxin [Chloroflexi bacterium]|nr:thioredoxin [Chloroflexota bacterium]